ncbi:MAG: radical SAM protein [Eubacterium sp.]|nr:radical SAM protein [Eubacterium sp.]
MMYYENAPKMVMFEITTKCNLHCVYCAARKLVKKPEDLPISQIAKIVRKFNDFEYVCLCGLGESLLHADFYEVLHLLKDKKVVLVTNGSVPIDFEKLTVANNIDAISFSVDDGTEQGMKRISDNYRFDVLLNNLKTAAEYKIHTAINCTLVKENINSIDAIKESAIKYQVSRFKVGFPFGSGKWIKDNSKEIKDVLGKIKEALQSNNIEYEGPTAIKCAFAGAPIAVVAKNGNVYPCCDYFCQRPLVGNLYHSSFQTMWEKSSYDKFRTGVYCKTCVQYHNNKEIMELYEKTE